MPKNKHNIQPFIPSANYIKPTLYLVCGCAGSGKSWVCKQLTDKFTYISQDEHRKKDHVDLLRAAGALTKPILHDANIKISTFIRRHSDEFDIHAVFIIEDEATVKQRIESRGGIFTDHIPKRMDVMVKRSAKYGEFAGTSGQVLEYLKSKV